MCFLCLTPCQAAFAAETNIWKAIFDRISSNTIAIVPVFLFLLERINNMIIIYLFLCGLIWTIFFMAIPITKYSSGAAGQWILQIAITCAIYYGVSYIERNSCPFKFSENKQNEKPPSNPGVTLLKTGILCMYTSLNTYNIEKLFFQLLICLLSCAVMTPLLCSKAETHRLSLHR